MICPQTEEGVRVTLRKVRRLKEEGLQQRRDTHAREVNTTVLKVVYVQIGSKPVRSDLCQTSKERLNKSN